MNLGKPNALPPLAFGLDAAVEHSNAREYGDLIDKSFPGLNAYDPIGDQSSFRTKTVEISLETSKIMATAISPTVVDRESNPVLTFILPYAGHAESSTQIDGQLLRWGGNRGVFLPATDQRVLGIGGFRSHIMWKLEHDRLLATAQTMLAKDTPVNLELERSRLLPEEIAGVRTSASWQAMLPLLQLHREHPKTLVQLSVEDMLYRHSVMLLRPDLFMVESEEYQSSNGQRHKKLLDRLCEYVLEHPELAWSLSELERFSGLSARSLQVAFNLRFGKAPMLWIKEARLSRVRRELQLHPDTPIDLIAHAAGFRTMPSFFKAYKEMFGETPGQTKTTSVAVGASIKNIDQQRN